MTQNNNFKKKIELLFHDADWTGHVSAKALSNYLQSTATLHSRSLGTSIDHFSVSNLTWVYSRFHLFIDEYPVYTSTIFIETWRSQTKGPFAYREFKIYNDENKIIAGATASLALIDKTTRKPVDIPEVLLNQFSPESGRALEDDFSPLFHLNNPENETEIPVRFSDLDLNSHVNNVSYLDWITEGLPEFILLNHRLKEIEIEYRAEAFRGDTIISQSSASKEKNGFFHHRLIRKNDMKEISFARTRWTKIK